MAYDLTELKSQVQLLSGHDNLASKVETWANRVCHEILLRAFWAHQTDRTLLSPSLSQCATGVTTVSPANWGVAVSSVQSRQVLNVLGMAALTAAGSTITTGAAVSYKNPVARVGLKDLLGMHSGYTGGGVTSNYPQFYHARLVAGTTGNTVARNLQVEMFPRFSGTAATSNGLLQADVIVGLNDLSGGDINWMISRYFATVLAGVMRYVRLYLGDAQGYLVEKGEFENGVKDMLLREETLTLNAPVMRSAS